MWRELRSAELVTGSGVAVGADVARERVLLLWMVLVMMTRGVTVASLSDL